MEKFELTYPERNIWLVETFYDKQLINIISGSFVIKRDFNLDLAEKMVNKYVELNDAMRLRINLEGGIPKQYVSSYAPFVSDKVNAQGKSEEEIENIKDEYIKKQIYVLEDPLASFLLIDRGNGLGEVFVKVHHLVGDAWTISKMGTIFSEIYEALLAGEEYTKEFPSYVDFIKAEQEYLLDDRYASDSEFWKEYLTGLEEPVGLKDSGIIKDTRAKRYTIVLDDNYQAMLDNYCKTNRLSPYTVFLTALAVYMERTTGKQDFVIGTPVLNRSNFKEKNMAGMFISTMPVRFNIDEAKTFLDMCKEAGSDSLTLFRHQKHPYVKISEIYKKLSGVTDNMYKVMLSYQNARASVAVEDKYELKWRFSGHIQDELEIHISDLNATGNLEVHLDYLTNLFEDIEIKYLATRLLEIIKDGITNNSTVETIKIMTDDERNKILGEFNNTTRPYPKDKTVIELFDEQVNAYPDNIALKLEDKSMTYKELDIASNKLANMLKAKGVVIGDAIGIDIDKSFELMVAILAVLKTGAYYLPVEINIAHDKKEYMFKDANVKFVLEDHIENYEDIQEIFIEELDYSKLQDTKVTLDKDYTSLSPACILYTSGTTGNPKGALITNMNIVKLVKNPDYMELKASDTIIQAASTSFDVSLFEFFGTLLNGGTCALITKENLLDFEYLNKYIKEAGVTIAWITSALFNQIIDAKIEVFETLHTVLSGGDVMSLKHVNKLRETYKDLTIINCYGPTECVTFTNTFRVDETRTVKVPLGRAISNTYGYVIDKKFRLLPLYVEGEYIIGGDSVGLKYINNETLTKERFVEDKITNKGRMYKTGDVVRMLEGGYIDFVGRRDNQVKVRGYRIELDEIKHAIYSSKKVEDLSVFIYEDHNKTKKIAAIYTTNEDFLPQDMKIFLKDKLTSYKIPSYIERMDKLPLNQNGKVNVKELIKHILEESKDIDEEFVPEYEGIAKTIYDMFRDVLGREDIHPEDSFFEIGGDSLLAIRLTTEALEHNIKITFADLYKYPSIKELTELLTLDNKKASISEPLKTRNFDEIHKLLETNKITDDIVKEEVKEGSILLAGATGFLGSHILEELLVNTDSTIYCLIRKIKNSDKTPKDRLKEKVNFFFGDKYDDIIDTRVKCVEGDIILENLIVDDTDREEVIKNVSMIINSAAHVKHYGDINLFTKINAKGVENLAKFALENNMRLIHISTLSVSGNILEVGQLDQVDIEKGTIYNETNLYIGQNLDNVYAYTKFLGEEVVYNYILKGLDAKVMRMGNLTSRMSDGKFQPNVEENAFANRLKTFVDIGIMPSNLMNFNVEFTPIDLAAKAIRILANTDRKYNTYHIFNDNHIVMHRLDEILYKLGYELKHITKEQMTELIEFYSKQDNGYERIQGIVQDVNRNKEIDYNPNTVIKSDFTKDTLSKLGFEWPEIDEEYITKYIEYLEKIGFLKGDNK
ncbi:MAG: amino acid adenylation domain-containing protein [Clostridia bacterium]|nr:amino acid adenylation domain-containing protein [Clostridia bacterium]